jgi:hypothetical protein
MGQHLLSLAAQEDAREPAAPVGGHEDGIAAVQCGGLDDFFIGMKDITISVWQGTPAAAAASAIFLMCWLARF